MPQLRAMTDSDVEAAADVWGDAFGALAREYHVPSPDRSRAGTDRLGRRIRHFLSTDPEGSFVAEDGGEVVGLSQSLVREGYWMLSLLGVRPDAQGRGLGRTLLQLALGNAPLDSAATIQSSRDPAALALYSLAGFDLHPAVVARGRIRPGSVHPHPSVRAGGQIEIAIVDEIDRAVRGAARGVDIRAMLAEPGNTLLLYEDRGYAVSLHDRLVTLGARDEAVAVALLTSAFARAGAGAPFELAWLTGSQQWAIRTAIGAGLELNQSGAVMVRGMSGPPWPYVPSGGYG